MQMYDSLLIIQRQEHDNNNNNLQVPVWKKWKREKREKKQTHLTLRSDVYSHFRSCRKNTRVACERGHELEMGWTEPLQR